MTGILAVAIPYCGIFAKVFAEVIEEADLSAERVLPAGTATVSAFAYVRIPELAPQFWTYSLYRLECGLRSSLVLGFIGLPTIGFHLNCSFKQGYYAQASALLFAFYVLIGTRRIWRDRPPYRFSSWRVAGPAGSSGRWLDDGNFLRFITHDIVPAPLRGADFFAAATWANLAAWLGPIDRRRRDPVFCRRWCFLKLRSWRRA